MKKAILIIAALLVMASCGNSRFETVSYGVGSKIIYDKETKVEYVVGSFGKMTVLVDKDGKPLIYEGEK